MKYTTMNMKKYVTMEIKNHLLKEAGFQASICYCEDEEGHLLRAVIFGEDETGYDSIIHDEFFSSIRDAISFIEENVKEIAMENLTRVANKGKVAQDHLNTINQYGFTL